MALLKSVAAAAWTLCYLTHFIPSRVTGKHQALAVMQVREESPLG